jgi:hypothetical protein
VAAFSDYNERTSARRAAQVFAGDLTLARSMAVRGRETVTVKFNEGKPLVHGDHGDRPPAGAAELRIHGRGEPERPEHRSDGDSVRFSSRGIANLGRSTLGSAVFRAGTIEYQVQFNSMGTSKVGEL